MCAFERSHQFHINNLNDCRQLSSWAKFKLLLASCRCPFNWNNINIPWMGRRITVMYMLWCLCRSILQEVWGRNDYSSERAMTAHFMHTSHLKQNNPTTIIGLKAHGLWWRFFFLFHKTSWWPAILLVGHKKQLHTETINQSKSLNKHHQ